MVVITGIKIETGMEKKLFITRVENRICAHKIGIDRPRENKNFHTKNLAVNVQTEYTR